MRTANLQTWVPCPWPRHIGRYCADRREAGAPIAVASNAVGEPSSAAISEQEDAVRVDIVIRDGACGQVLDQVRILGSPPRGPITTIGSHGEHNTELLRFVLEHQVPILSEEPLAQIGAVVVSVWMQCHDEGTLGPAPQTAPWRALDAIRRAATLNVGWGCRRGGHRRLRCDLQGCWRRGWLELDRRGRCRRGCRVGDLAHRCGSWRRLGSVEHEELPNFLPKASGHDIVGITVHFVQGCGALALAIPVVSYDLGVCQVRRLPRDRTFAPVVHGSGPPYERRAGGAAVAVRVEGDGSVLGTMGMHHVVVRPRAARRPVAVAALHGHADDEPGGHGEGGEGVGHGRAHDPVGHEAAVRVAHQENGRSVDVVLDDGRVGHLDDVVVVRRPIPLVPVPASHSNRKRDAEATLFEIRRRGRPAS
mmetsp:Transcript_1267/g.2955  ORF Transcript_1267/g.2955 Transcript_1267/m.2955 type:complete len:420 (+) Transcript_1267:918-2177(+)